MNSLKLLAVLTAAISSLTLAQSQEQSPDAIRAEDLMLEHFTPQYAPAERLHQLGFEMAGCQREVLTSSGEDSTYVSNLFSFGDSVMIYDTPEHVASLRLLLTTLDSAYESSGEGYGVASIKILHLSQTRVRSLLDSFYPGDFEYVAERNTVLLRGSNEDNARAASLLEGLDQPTTQVLISCFLIRGADSPDDHDERVPEELATHLSTLLPYESFELFSQAVLRSSVHPANGQIELRMEPDSPSAAGVLELLPGGFDPETQTLTLDRCKFGFSYEEDPPSTLFRTSTAIRAGEYTVLGAAGMSPMFVVLRFELL